MGKITIELAKQEINHWLDNKKIFASVRKKQKSNISILAEAMSEGYLVYDPETNGFKHILIHPITNDGKETLKELKYKGRLNDKELQPHMLGIKPTDGLGMMQAHVAALTTTPRAVIAVLDTADRKIAHAIAVFFM